MKVMRSVVLVFLLLLTLSLFSCNGNAGTLSVTTQQLPSPGNPQPFTLFIFNGTQFPLVVTINVLPNGPSTPQLLPGANVVIVPVGSTGALDINYLPSSIAVDAAIYLPPPNFTFPARTLSLGSGFGFFDSSVTVSYP